jgi:transposase InsO family protein
MDQNYDVEHRSGRDHSDADCLSRSEAYFSDLRDRKNVPVSPPALDNDCFGLGSIAAFTEGGEPRARDKSEIVIAQRRDPWISYLREVLEKNEGARTALERKQTANLVVASDIVLRRAARKNAVTFQTLVPAELQQKLLVASHEDSGHPGVHKVRAALRMRYHWSYMDNDVHRHIRACAKCSLKKPDYLGPVPMESAAKDCPKPIEGIFQRVSIDLLEISHATLRKNKYIIIAVCNLTKFIVARALRDRKTSTMIKFLREEILLRFGLPKEVIHDRAKEFMSKDFEAFASENGFALLPTSGYRPTGNAISERTNLTVKSLLYFFNEEASLGSSWDLYLPAVVMAFNCQVHETTQFSPHYLVYGYQPRRVIDAQIGQIDFASEESAKFAHPSKTQARLLQAREHAYARTQKLSQHAVDKHNITRKTRAFTPGSQVMVKRMPRPPGTLPFAFVAYEGPYTVMRQRDAAHVEVRHADWKKEQGNWLLHVDRCKPAYKAETSTAPTVVDARVTSDAVNACITTERAQELALGRQAARSTVAQFKSRATPTRALGHAPGQQAARSTAAQFKSRATPNRALGHALKRQAARSTAAQPKSKARETPTRVQEDAPGRQAARNIALPSKSPALPTRAQEHAPGQQPAQVTATRTKSHATANRPIRRSERQSTARGCAGAEKIDYRHLQQRASAY